MTNFSLNGLKMYANTFDMKKFQNMVIGILLTVPVVVGGGNSYIKQFGKETFSNDTTKEKIVENPVFWNNGTYSTNNIKPGYEDTIQGKLKPGEDFKTFSKTDNGDYVYAGMTQNAQDRYIENNVIFLVSYDTSSNSKDSYFSMGTGTIIANSGDTKSNVNKILTVNHVPNPGSQSWRGFENRNMGDNIFVLDKTGTIIAKARIAFQPSKNRDRQDMKKWTENDYSILEITEASPDYLKKTGLKIAPVVSGNILEATVKTPHNMTHGASGGPILDKNGNIIGLLSRGWDLPGKYYTPSQYGKLHPNENDNVISSPAITKKEENILISSASITESSVNIFTPINSEILKHLNQAGKHTRITYSDNYKYEGSRLIGASGLVPTLYHDINVSVTTPDSKIFAYVKDKDKQFTNNFTYDFCQMMNSAGSKIDNAIGQGIDFVKEDYNEVINTFKK